jgi:hypothetical protein
MDKTIAKGDDPAHIRNSFGKSLIKAYSLLQSLSDDFRLPFNRGLDHFNSEELVKSNSFGKLQVEPAVS